jgi:hypothetical protein
MHAQVLSYGTCRKEELALNIFDLSIFRARWCPQQRPCGEDPVDIREIKTATEQAYLV